MELPTSRESARFDPPPAAPRPPAAVRHWRRPPAPPDLMSLRRSLLLLCLSVPALAQQAPRPLRVEDGDSWRSLGEARLSETGQWVLYRLTPAHAADGELHVVRAAGDLRRRSRDRRNSDEIPLCICLGASGGATARCSHPGIGEQMRQLDSDYQCDFRNPGKRLWHWSADRIRQDSVNQNGATALFRGGVFHGQKAVVR